MWQGMVKACKILKYPEQGRSQGPDFGGGGGRAHLRGVGRHSHQGILTFYIGLLKFRKIRVPHSGSLGKKNLRDHQVDRK